MAKAIKVSTTVKVEDPTPEDVEFLWATVSFWWETKDEKTAAHPSLEIRIPVGTSEFDSDSISSLTCKAREKAKRLLEEALEQF